MPSTALQPMRNRLLRRSLSSILMLCFLGLWLAPGIQAQSKPTVDVQTTSTEVPASDPVETSADEAADNSEEARASYYDDDDRLYQRAPRNDTVQLNRTLGTVVSGLLFGVVGLAFGPVGLFLGGALGAGLGYLVSRDLFEDPNRQYPSEYLSDPSYDSRYSGTSGLRPSGVFGYTASPGTPLHDLQQTYFEALAAYKKSLRTQDIADINAKRVVYQDAYAALLRGTQAASR